jgi:hypothetical protein
VHHRRYKTRAAAEREIAEYIEVFYNRQQVCGERMPEGVTDPRLADPRRPDGPFHGLL